MNEMDNILKTAISAAVEGGNVLLEHANDFMKASQKESLRDIVTEIDKYAEKKIINILKKYNIDIPILSEESKAALPDDCANYWIVDPLDGTVNYINKIPSYAVSVAFMENNKLSRGVVYSPTTNDLYYGAKNFGIYKNHMKITAKDKNPEECLFAVAFSGKNYDPLSRNDEFLMFQEVNDSSRGCLRTGSAAMNLAYVAEGKLGGCWGKANKIWDVAGGILLAELAGAVVHYEVIDEKEKLVNYIVAVRSAFNFIGAPKNGVKNNKSFFKKDLSI